MEVFTGQGGVWEENENVCVRMSLCVESYDYENMWLNVWWRHLCVFVCACYTWICVVLMQRTICQKTIKKQIHNNSSCTTHKPKLHLCKTKKHRKDVFKVDLSIFCLVFFCLFCFINKSSKLYSNHQLFLLLEQKSHLLAYSRKWSAFFSFFLSFCFYNNAKQDNLPQCCLKSNLVTIELCFHLRNCSHCASVSIKQLFSQQLQRWVLSTLC